MGINAQAAEKTTSEKNHPAPLWRLYESGGICRCHDIRPLQL